MTFTRTVTCAYTLHGHVHVPLFRVVAKTPWIHSDRDSDHNRDRNRDSDRDRNRDRDRDHDRDPDRVFWISSHDFGHNRDRDLDRVRDCEADISSAVKIRWPWLWP